MKYYLVRRVQGTRIIHPETGKILKVGDSVEIEGTQSPERLLNQGLSPEKPKEKKARKGKE